MSKERDEMSDKEMQDLLLEHEYQESKRKEVTPQYLRDFILGVFQDAGIHEKDFPEELAALDAMTEKAVKGELFEKLEWLYVSGDWTKTVRPGAKTLREFAEALKAVPDV